MLLTQKSYKSLNLVMLPVSMDGEYSHPLPAAETEHQAQVAHLASGNRDVIKDSLSAIGLCTNSRKVEEHHGVRVQLGFDFAITQTPSILCASLYEAIDSCLALWPIQYERTEVTQLQKLIKDAMKQNHEKLLDNSSSLQSYDPSLVNLLVSAWHSPILSPCPK